MAIADPTQSDVPGTTAADLMTKEGEIGRIDADPHAFVGIQDEATAEDVLGYYVAESVRLAPLFAIEGVPWWEGYSLEVGDLVNATPPWESAARKCRVIEYVKSFESEQVELRLVEVA